VGLIAINANGINLTSAMVQHCILRCARAGRECTEIYMAEFQLRQSDSSLKTLGGLPLHGVEDIEHGSLLFCDAQGTIVELHDLATPVLIPILKFMQTISTPAGTRSQPAPTTRALPPQDAVPDELG